MYHKNDDLYCKYYVKLNIDIIMTDHTELIRKSTVKWVTLKLNS